MKIRYMIAIIPAYLLSQNASAFVSKSSYDVDAMNNQTKSTVEPNSTNCANDYYFINPLTKKVSTYKIGCSCSFCTMMNNLCKKN